MQVIYNCMQLICGSEFDYEKAEYFPRIGRREALSQSSDRKLTVLLCNVSHDTVFYARLVDIRGADGAEIHLALYHCIK